MLDNAKYHHNIAQPDFAKFNKADFVDLLKNYGTSALIAIRATARATAGSRALIHATYTGVPEVTIATRSPPMRFEVTDALKGTASKANGLPSKSELQAATLLWFQQNRPDMLQAKLVNDFHKPDRKWIVLFTPPYCADLQPIELFWAAGKNYARQKHEQGVSLEAVVANLREGWYGVPGVDGKGIVNCDGMIKTSIKKANEWIATDECISGTVEEGITVTVECDLTVSIDDIGRCTRRMCHRALAASTSQEEEDEPDEEIEDGDEDDDIGEEIN